MKYRLTEDAQRALQNQIDDFARSLNTPFEAEDIPAELKSQVYPYRDKLAAALTVLNDSLHQVEQKLDALGQLLGEYKSVTLTTDGLGTGTGFRGHRSFEEFLLAVKRNWSAVVTNEREAMEKAADYYKLAFTEGRDIAPGNQQIQAAYLIAELSRRIGNYEEARQYFNNTIRHGQEFIHKNRHDSTQTALARKILELAIEQGKSNMAAMKSLEKTGTT
jgi:tetratricopeptide (TPR) repeat protein